MSFVSELRQVAAPSHPPHEPPSPTSLAGACDHRMPLATVAARTRRPVGRALACAIVTYAVTTGLLLGVVTTRVPAGAKPHDPGAAMGWAVAGAVITSALPLLVAGPVVRRVSRGRSRWPFAAIFLLTFCLGVAFWSMLG